MNIILNGKNYTTQAETLYQLINEQKSDKDCVVIFEGFQTDKDEKLSENSNVSIIKKGVMPPLEELEAMISARHTPGVYSKLKGAKVAIAGLGGLGSSIGVALARSCVGELLLVDFDIVEPSNLNRQQYTIASLGKAKTEALKDIIGQINPFVKVVTKNIKITEENAIEVFEGYNIVCEAFDKAEYKATLINTLLTQNNTIQIVSGSGMAGYESSNTIVTKKIGNRLYICGDGTTEAKIGRGLMAPRVGICAMHQANMVLRLILNIKDI